MLGGGGARAAYQAGVLQGIAEILAEQGGDRYGPHPFHVITGVSAGSINASYIAAAQTSFTAQAQTLARIWSELRSERVLNTSGLTLGRIGLRWLRELGFPSAKGAHKSTYLLDSSPLHALLGEHLKFDDIRRNLSRGVIGALGVTATSYATGTSITFFESALEHAGWSKSGRIGLPTSLTLEHVLASSSIPVFFAPVRIRESFYGDGSIRSTTPLSPAIHLGADRLLAIGVRAVRSGVETRELHRQTKMDSINLAEIAGVAFNSLFLDSLESDAERLTRINQTVALITRVPGQPASTALRTIPLLLIRPSIDLGALACDHFHRFPRVFRFLLHGIGASAETGSDLLSYLAFDQAYTQKLVEAGLRDARAQREEIAAFFA